MRRYVLRWSKQCQVCATSMVARHTIPPILPIPAPAERFAHVHVDIVGPFSPDQGKRYLLTMIDRTTRWPEAIPMEDTTADTVLQTFLECWVSRFGIPLTVTSDRGAQFTSQLWNTTLGRLGVNISATTAYHPQANGVVERFHRTLKNALRCAVRSSQSWTRSLPWVLLRQRSALKIDTATFTAEVVYRAPLRIPGLCFQSKQPRKSSATEQLELARSNASAFSPASLDLGRFRTSPFIAKSLRTAKFVYVRDDCLGKASLAPKYTGPYKVTAKNWDNNTFTLDFGRKRDVVSLS